MSANVIQWKDAECDMLVMERIRQNQQYHNIVGRSRVEFWRSVVVPESHYMKIMLPHSGNK
jgi:hypothetical protein